MSNINISKRLKATADMVTPGYRLCDVGCDHGYLPIYLVKMGIIPSALACDINEGPLERAKENIRAYGLSEKISTRLSNGLEKVAPKEADTITICGMGGVLISDIIKRGIDVIRSAKELIVSPQSDIALVRHSLYECGIGVTDENIIKEDGKFYFLIKGSVTEKAPLDEIANGTFTDYGTLLVKRGDATLKEYLKKEQKRLMDIMKSLPENAAERKSTVSAELEGVEKCLSVM